MNVPAGHSPRPVFHHLHVVRELDSVEPPVVTVGRERRIGFERQQSSARRWRGTLIRLSPAEGAADGMPKPRPIA